MSIERLSDIVIAQIAAGEVIERPASVVKELLENALDAGATTVQIEAVQGGKRRLRISDNGSGISSDQVELAFARHATSKLRTADDLERLLTLGFRGEALSSIASVSRVTLTTRHREENTGTEIRLEGGALIRHQPTGAPAGTIISVEDLFFNTPARLKFLKKEATEKRYISTLVTRYAMAYPGVRFVYEQDGREAFRSTGSGQLADVVVKSFGIDAFKQFVEVDSQERNTQNGTEIRVHGFASLPELTRGDRTQITLFLNGRWIQDSSLTYAVVQAYHTLLPANRYPFAVLMIDMPPDEVDVNVHPTKAEVRFRHADHVFTAVQRAVREAIMRTADTGSKRFTASQEMTPERRGTRQGGWNSHIQLDLNLDNNTSEKRATSAQNTLEDDTAIPEGPDGPRRPRTLPPLRVIGQIGAMYIVAEGPAGMYLIDQNAAHTRILYETLLEDYAREITNTQELSGSETVELSAAQTQIVSAHMDMLARMGLLLEPFGPTTFVIRGIPAFIYAQVSVPAALVSDAIGGLSKDDAEAIALTAQGIARHAAFRSGQILNEEQMRDIIRKLERCDNPHASPDGRATLIHLSGDQLAREFARS